MIFTISCLLFLSLFVTSTVIETKLGALEGVQGTARNGDSYTAFLGVPFAKPPLGELRFRPPVPVEAWNGVRQATENADQCFYTLPYTDSPQIGSEDCLYLNVFTKHPGDVSAKKPVLVWFHAGSFIYGGAAQYPPEHLMEEDVVLVIIQYRTNVFGFLSFDDPEAPGNYGMLDQVQALKWTNQYIAEFGGDSESICLFGVSAGAASVHYHMLSPKSTNLFNTAISFSGSSLNWWAYHPDTKSTALTIAEATGCIRDTVKEMVDCLRTVDGDTLYKTQRLFFKWKPDCPCREPQNAFSPRWDPESEDPFLPDHPVVLMRKGKINPAPYMMGYAEKECSFRGNALLPDVKDSPIWKSFLDDFDYIMPYALGLYGNQTADMRGDVSKALAFYNITPEEFMEEKLTDDKVHALVDLFSDSMLNYGILETADLHSQHAKTPTYVYYLTYAPLHSFANFGSEHVNHIFRRPRFAPLRMASHGSETLLLFPMFPAMGEYPPEDVEASRNLIKLVLDFAVNGKPTRIQWPQYEAGAQPYLEIGDKFEIKSGLPYQQNMEFWRTLDIYWKNILKVKGQVNMKESEAQREEL